MSVDPNSGIAYITMYDSVNGQLSNGAQFSGVLIAPDEILTVAHGVTDSAGNIRNFGTAYLGYDGGSLTGGIGIASVHVLDNSHPSDVMSTDSANTTDFAVIHLSQAVTSATTFVLGTGAPGTYTISGYPASANGRVTSVTEDLTKGVAVGELTGTSLVPTGTAAGASGSPVYAMVNGTPTVVGLDVAEDRLGHTSVVGFSQGQIDQIKSWVYADDAGQAWGSAFAPTQSPATGVTGGQAETGSTAQTPAPTDRLDQLATLLNAAAEGATGQKATMMTDVASALTIARQQGNSGSDIADSTDVASDLLDGISAPRSVPRPSWPG